MIDGISTVGGGGGGAGGYGTVVVVPGVFSGSGNIVGGNGGNGGLGQFAGAGAGGSGGAGIVFAAGGASISNSGTIGGGNGAAGGAGAPSGANGAGGPGILGGDLTITTSNSITGGLSGDGVTRASAITFTGGVNTLELQAGWTITGNVMTTAGTSKLQLGGSGNSGFFASEIGGSAKYQGFTSFEKTGGSDWILADDTTASTPWTISGGTLTIISNTSDSLGDNSGRLTMNGGTLHWTGAWDRIVRPITLAGAGTFNVDPAHVLFLRGNIDGPGQLVTAAPAGVARVILTGTNSYTGGTTVNSRTEIGETGGAQGRIVGSVTVNNNSGSTNGLLYFVNANVSGLTAVTVNGFGFAGFFGGTTLGSTTITTNGGSTQFSDSSSAGTATLLTKTATNFDNTATAGQANITAQLNGLIRFNSGSNAGTANISANFGRIFFFNSSTAASSTLSLAGGSTLTFFNTSSGGQARVINAAGNLADFSQLSSGGTTVGSIEGGGNFVLGSKQLTVGGNGLSTVVSGVLSGTGGSLIKVGSGTLTLNGANTYTGGTIVNGGTLAGSGSIGSVGINSGARLSPGSSAGILTTGSLSLASNGTLAIELNGTTAGTSYDQVNVNGTVTLSGATLSLAVGFPLADGQSFTIINNDGADGVTGAFAGLPEGGTLMMAGRTIEITYRGGTGNDVVLSVQSGQSDQTITFLPLGGRTYGDAPFTVGANASSGLIVSFSTKTPAVCAITSGGSVTIVAAGTCTIAADQGGDDTYTPAPQVLQTFTVAKANQAIAFTPPSAKNLNDPPFTIAATSTSGLAVTFTSLTADVCTVAGGTVTLGAAGTCTIAANQGGDGNYNAAIQITRSIAVAPECSLLTPTAGRLAAGFVALPYSQSFTLDGGVSPVTFSVSGTLPGGLSFSNGVLSGTPAARGAFSFTVSGIDASSCQSSRTYTLAISAERRLVVGAGAGGNGAARAFTLASGTVQLATNSGSAFNGGVSVATADVDGNSVADVITGAGPGAPPTVTVFDGVTGVARLTFFAYPSTFRGGVEVAAGDVNGDGRPEILVVQGCDTVGNLFPARAFDGVTGALVRQYVIESSVNACGLHVAAGDVNGDGLADLVVGSAGVGPAFVLVIDSASDARLREFFPYTSGYLGGVHVAAGDVNGDGFADIVTGAGPGGTPHVRVFDGVTGNQIAGALGSFLAYPSMFAGGVRVAAGDLNGDGRADVITGAGPGGGPHVRVFDGATTSELFGFFAFDPSFSGGVFVAAPVTSARMAIDVAARTTGTDVRIAGWALREIAADTNGNDAIHAWALPVAGGLPIFVGAAPTRVARPDVASLFGGEFLNSGFDITGTLAPGTYDLVVFALNTRTRRFDQVRVIRMTVQ